MAIRASVFDSRLTRSVPATTPTAMVGSITQKNLASHFRQRKYTTAISPMIIMGERMPRTKRGAR